MFVTKPSDLHNESSVAIERHITVAVTRLNSKFDSKLDSIKFELKLGK